MIKLLEDLLIEASTDPNVPGSLVAGLRKAVETARAEALPLWPRRDKDGKVYDLPGAVPAPHSVCVVEHHDKMGITRRVGDVLPDGPNVRSFPLHWLPCDKDGWVSDCLTERHLPGVQCEVRVGGDLTQWRPLPPKPSAIDEMVPVGSPYFVRLVEGDGYRAGQVVVGDDGMNAYPAWAPCDKDGWVELGVAVGVQVPHIEFRQPGNQWRPKPSAIDEMAEQMKRWAAPTHEDFDKAIDGLSQAMGVPKRRLLGQAQSEPTPALAVQEGGSHYKDMKIQPVEYIHANGLGYFEGNVVKYVSRWRAKGGLQDLKKARHYLDLLIELEGDTK